MATLIITSSSQLVTCNGNSMLDLPPSIIFSSMSGGRESNTNYYKGEIADSSTPELVSDSERSSIHDKGETLSSPVSVRGIKKISPNFGHLGDSLRAHELRQSTRSQDNSFGPKVSNENINELRLPALIDGNSKNMAKVYSAIGSLETNSFAEHNDMPSQKHLLVSCIRKKTYEGTNATSQAPPTTLKSNKTECPTKMPLKKVSSHSDVLASKIEDPETTIGTTTHEPALSNNDELKRKRKKKKKVKISSGPVELFRPSCDAYTPRINQKKNIPYRHLATREPQAVTTMGTISRPNFSDVLRRVAMIMHQHILKIERRFGESTDDSNLFCPEMRKAFSEENFITPTFKCTTVRVPMARPGAIYTLQKVHVKYNIPTISEIYDFAHSLFQKVQLSSECSIVCLIYVERLMELAKVPLVADTWRPIFMCGLLLASKVWQDLSSWNIEFSNVYPQYSLEAISRMETQFLKMVKWDLYISSSRYAKYYFALRSLVEKKDFRQRYNQMVGVAGSVDAKEALKVQQRTEIIKEVALSQYSRSM